MKKIGLFLLLTILCFANIKAQPVIAMGLSKSYIGRYLANYSQWALSSESNKTKLVYFNREKQVTVTYIFLRDSPRRIAFTCVETIIQFPNADSLQQYISDRLIACRFKPDKNGWIYLTDLYDLPIHVYQNNLKLTFKY